MKESKMAEKYSVVQRLNKVPPGVIATLLQPKIPLKHSLNHPPNPLTRALSSGQVETRSVSPVNPAIQKRVAISNSHPASRPPNPTARQARRDQKNKTRTWSGMAPTRSSPRPSSHR